MRQTCARKVVALALLLSPQNMDDRSMPPCDSALARPPLTALLARKGTASVSDTVQCSRRSVPAQHTISLLLLLLVVLLVGFVVTCSSCQRQRCVCRQASDKHKIHKVSDEIAAHAHCGSPFGALCQHCLSEILVPS